MSVFKINDGKQRNGGRKLRTALFVAEIDALGLFGICLQFL
jgi:hypothetical protein